jgi:hypothetical protein
VIGFETSKGVQKRRLRIIGFADVDCYTSREAHESANRKCHDAIKRRKANVRPSADQRSEIGGDS